MFVRVCMCVCALKGVSTDARSWQFQYKTLPPYLVLFLLSKITSIIIVHRIQMQR